MKITTFRYNWQGYFLKSNYLLRIQHYLFGTLFVHSREIGHYIFSNLIFEKNETILDIGCGDGIMANWICYHTGCKVIGVDKLKERLKKAGKVARRYKLANEFICCDIEKRPLSFPQKRFDKVLLVDVLEHAKNPQLVIRSALRFLKRDGVVVISTPTSNQQRILLKRYKDFFNYGSDNHYFEGFDKKKLVYWLKANGVRNIRVLEIYYGFYQLGWELSELIRKINKDIYSFLVPFFSIFAFIDREVHIGRNNGLIIIAKKYE